MIKGLLTMLDPSHPWQSSFIAASFRRPEARQVKPEGHAGKKSHFVDGLERSFGQMVQPYTSQTMDQQPWISFHLVGGDFEHEPLLAFYGSLWIITGLISMDTHWISWL